MLNETIIEFNLSLKVVIFNSHSFKRLFIQLKDLLTYVTCVHSFITRNEWMTGFSCLYSRRLTIFKPLCTCNIKTNRKQHYSKTICGCIFHLLQKTLKQHSLPRAPFLLWLPIQYMEQCMTAPPRALMMTTTWER